MGLRDILQGMKNGPRGQRQPSSSGSSGGGISRIMMALLALFAYKALKGNNGRAAPTNSGNPRTPTRRGAAGCSSQRIATAEAAPSKRRSVPSGFAVYCDGPRSPRATPWIAKPPEPA